MLMQHIAIPAHRGKLDEPSAITMRGWALAAASSALMWAGIGLLLLQ